MRFGGLGFKVARFRGLGFYSTVDSGKSCMSS